MRQPTRWTGVKEGDLGRRIGKLSLSWREVLRNSGRHGVVIMLQGSLKSNPVYAET